MKAVGYVGGSLDVLEEMISRVGKWFCVMRGR